MATISSLSQLKAGIDSLASDAIAGRYNVLEIKHFGGVARVLGENSIANQAEELLRNAPEELFWAGVLTNIELPEMVPEAFRRLDTIESLEKSHPIYSEVTIRTWMKQLAATEKHIACCLEHRFDEALAVAEPDLHLEEVGSTMAVLGEIDRALSVAQMPTLEVSRQRGIRLVSVIELYRRGRFEEAAKLLGDLEADGNRSWWRAILALGFGNREPWAGYPYPDY